MCSTVQHKASLCSHWMKQNQVRDNANSIQHFMYFMCAYVCLYAHYIVFLPMLLLKYRSFALILSLSLLFSLCHSISWTIFKSIFTVNWLPLLQSLYILNDYTKHIYLTLYSVPCSHVMTTTTTTTQQHINKVKTFPFAWLNWLDGCFVSV